MGSNKRFAFDYFFYIIWKQPGKFMGGGGGRKSNKNNYLVFLELVPTCWTISGLAILTELNK